MATPSAPTERLVVGHEDLAGSDQFDDKRTEDVEITEETRAINQNEDVLEQDARTTEESEDNGEENDTESDLNDDAWAENAEITEGGWICRVERFEKHVDSQGHITYRHPPKRSSPPPKRSSPPLANRDLKDTQNAETLDSDETEGDVPESIISYFHQAVKSSSGDLIEPEIYIEIKSPLIIEVLRQNKSYRSLRGQILIFNEPYQLLWRQYHSLETYCKDQSNPKDGRTHITVLLDFLKTCDIPNVPELIALCDPNNDVRSISYASLWLLYTPGTLMVAQGPSLSYSKVFRIDSVKTPSRKIDKKGQSVYGTLRLNCQKIAYDGKAIGLESVRQTVESFQGAVSLSELAFKPLSLLDGHEKKRDSLIARGLKFWDLRGQHMKEFVDGSYANRSLAENERVMVDWAMHARQGNMFEGQSITPDRQPAADTDSTRGILSGYQPPAPWEVPFAKAPISSVPLIYEDEKPDEDTLILCDFLVWGFSLRSKKWRQYHVDDLIDVDFHKKSFDRLVLREDYKTILKAMVAQHFTQGQDRFYDLVAGKGQGLNILLHGPPGVGKTLTAECIADLYQRPLYSVTSGDIGTDPETVEGKLVQIFDYAVNWNAVLLLDEADVFLAERNLENLARNALVSVFLRSIEYFNGVLFLTTNRVGTVDEAFQSRLHITLGLDPLSVGDRREIWYHFIRDLKHLSKDDRRVLARHARDDWSHKDFNGRQIRNTVKTALTLARQDGMVVQARHFQIVLDIGTRFAGYMQRLKKMDRERLAEAIGTRLDLTANNLHSIDTPIVTGTSKRKSEDEPKKIGTEDVDFDWD